MIEKLHRNSRITPHAVSSAVLVTILCLAAFSVATSAQDEGRRDTDRKELIRAEQPPAPCFPNETAVSDVATVARRGEIINLPGPLETRLLQLTARPHTYLPIHAFAEADKPAFYFNTICSIPTAFSRTPSPLGSPESLTTRCRLPLTRRTAVSRPSEPSVW